MALIPLRHRRPDPRRHRLLHLCISMCSSLCHPRLLSLISDFPRHFFSDSFPFPVTQNDQKTPLDIINGGHTRSTNLPTQLISVVDLFHKGNPVFSRVIETDATSSPGKPLP